MPDEIRPNTVRNVSVQLTIVASSSVYSESNLLPSPPVSFWAQPCVLAIPVSFPNHSSLMPKPHRSHSQTIQSHAQTTPVSGPNHSSLMSKPLQSHAQTTPVSCPNHSSLTPKPLQSHAQTTPVSVPNHSSHASINRCHDILVPM